MLRTSGKHQRQEASRSLNLLVFLIGGRRLAMKTQEVAGISPWETSIPVASRTPFVTAVVRRHQVVLPVFDLAKLLRVSVQGSSPLCLTAKHPQGDMAICIDEEIPVLQTLDAAAIQAYRGKDVPAEWSYASGLDEIPILSVHRLGAVA
ncbi:MAG: chemotaxis protein CheW [Nitrospira sp.]